MRVINIDDNPLCNNKNHLVAKFILVLAGISVLLARKWLEDDLGDKFSKW